MKYCYQCNFTTQGEPLYCNSCGRTYDVKLCPRKHVNPRHAQACSQCGSRDLSTPQPKLPWWVRVLGFLASVIPALLLAVLTGSAIGFAWDHAEDSPEAVRTFLALIFTILWALWSTIPRRFRTAIYRMLRRRSGDDPGRSR